jgi:hypothetical protein
MINPEHSQEEVPVVAHESQYQLQHSEHQEPLDISSLYINTTNIQQRATLQHVINKTLKTIMNAAVTIFSMGLGVGLILGDSFNRTNNNTRTTGDSLNDDINIGRMDGSSGARMDGSIGDLDNAAGLTHRSIVGVSRPLLPPQ